MVGKAGEKSLWLHHDDKEREDKHTEKLQHLTEKGDIKQINMSQDWNLVF